jgi:hypothetical protein
MSSPYFVRGLFLGAVALSISYCLPAKAATFNVLGTETIDTIKLRFIISEEPNIAIPSKSWSQISKYQDDQTNQLVLLQYWKVSFNYDGEEKKLSLVASHLVDPHTGGSNPASSFSWTVGLPEAVNRLPQGGFRGSVRTKSVVSHPDSLGEKHSDRYSAVLFNFDDISQDFKTIDQVSVGFNGTHKIPEPSSIIGSFATVAFVTGVIRKRELGKQKAST